MQKINEVLDGTAQTSPGHRRSGSASDADIDEIAERLSSPVRGSPVKTKVCVALARRHCQLAEELTPLWLDSPLEDWPERSSTYGSLWLCSPHAFPAFLLLSRFSIPSSSHALTHKPFVSSPSRSFPISHMLPLLMTRPSTAPP